MSWVSQCKSCALREKCERGEVPAKFVSDGCEGDECLAWEPEKEVRK